MARKEYEEKYQDMIRHGLINEGLPPERTSEEWERLEIARLLYPGDVWE